MLFEKVIPMFVITALCFFVSLGSAQRLPSFISPCSLSSPDLNNCLRDAAQKALPFMEKGLPELGVPAIDPLQVDDIKVDQASLNVEFKNPSINGLKDCTINELKIDPVKRKILLNYTKDGFFGGKYKVKGQLLIIPIRGEGDSKIIFTRLNYVFKMDYASFKDNDGKERWKITKHKVTYAPEKAQFVFTNLFNGNKQLADTAMGVLNGNWKVIFTDLSPPIMAKATKSIVNVVDKFLRAIPIENLFVA